MTLKLEVAVGAKMDHEQHAPLLEMEKFGAGSGKLAECAAKRTLS